MLAVATGVEGGEENPGIVILDTAGQGLREVLWLIGSLGPAYSVSWSWDGSRVLGGSSDGSIRIWRVGPSLPISEASLLLLPVVVLLAAAPSSLIGSGQSSPFLGRLRRAVQL